MSLKRLLTPAVAALSVLALTPVAAQAGAGSGDDLNDAITPPGGVLPLSTARSPHILGYEVDTSAYTTEANEPLACSISRTSYAKTVWGGFRAPQYGRLDVTAAGFDSVIALFDITAKGSPEKDCTDRLASKIESFPRDRLPTVKKNHTYLVQIGGATQADGSVPGGPLSVDLELIRPDVTVGDAVLTWRGSRGGVRIDSLKVDGPRGSTITAGCLKDSCGRGVRLAVRKPLIAPIGTVGLGRRVAARPVVDRHGIAFGKTRVHAAAKQLFKGRKIKNGDTLLVAVQAEDQIGEIFYWRVKKNLAGTKGVGCIEPNSSRIKPLGTCTGK